LKICVYAGAEHAIDDNRTLKSVELFSEFSEIVYIYNSLFERDFESIKKQYAGKDVSFIGIHKNGSGLKSLVNFDKEAFKHIVECDADVWYIHNFFTRYPMKLFKEAKRRGKKLIYEIHEYVPDVFAEEKINSKGLKFLKRKIMLFLFKKMINSSDAIVTVNRLIYDIAKESSRPAYILPNLACFSMDFLSFEARSKELVVVGGTKRDITLSYNIAKEVYRKTGMTISTHIIGIPNTYKEVFIKNDSFMPYSEMMKNINLSLFSLISFRTYNLNSKNDIYCLPIKFFDSLGAGTPVIVDSYFKEMAYWTEKYGVGIVIDSSKPEKAAEKILEAMQEKKYSVFIQNIKANQSMFVWNEERKKDFLSFIRGVLKT